MVHAPGPPNIGSIGSALGPSQWFDIDGDADSKWCPAEGMAVLTLLKPGQVWGTLGNLHLHCRVLAHNVSFFPEGAFQSIFK